MKKYSMHFPHIFQKSLKVDPSDDDPRTIYLLFQAVSLSLQLSQSCGNGGKIQIFNPLLERDEEMLQSLVKLCMNAPYTVSLEIKLQYFQGFLSSVKTISRKKNSWECFVFYLSLQAKINIPEGFKPVESIGLYVLVNCFKPGILNYQSSILDIGMYVVRKLHW